MNEIETIFTQALIKSFIEKGVKSVSSLFETQIKKVNSVAKKKLENDDYKYFRENYDLEISENEVLKHLKSNFDAAQTWANEVNFSTAISSKKLNNIFVDIDLHLSPIKTRFDSEELTRTINSKNLIKDFTKNKIVYGGAGAGKTTLIKKIFKEVIKEKNDFSFPVVIRFRELDYENENYKKYGLFKILVDLIGINIAFPEKFIEDFSSEYHYIIKNTIIQFFNDCEVLLIADGFDEIPDNNLKKRIERDFNSLALELKESRFILTSRSNDFQLLLPNTNVYEICSLNDKQIKLLIGKWISSKKKAKELFDKIKSSPYYDTTMRPLTLSHLCAIYERKQTIPPKPRYIYDFVLNLLLEAWDQQRSIVRQSDYADFYIEKKKEFLGHLSFWLSYQLGKNVFDGDDIRKCYKQIHRSHNLPTSQAKKVVIELENHTGIFIQTGFNSFQFSHKSLQEFLTAKYLSALPRIPDIEVLNRLPNETAIMVCLSSNPNYYFQEFNKYFKHYNEQFWYVFFNRLIEEKPDFTENPGVLIFFLNNMWKNKNSLFQKIFLVLLSQTNLKVSINQFFKTYDLNGTYPDYTSFIFKDLKIPIMERNYYPSQLHIDSETYEILKNYT